MANETHTHVVVNKRHRRSVAGQNQGQNLDQVFEVGDPISPTGDELKFFREEGGVLHGPRDARPVRFRRVSADRIEVSVPPLTAPPAERPPAPANAEDGGGGSAKAAQPKASEFDEEVWTSSSRAVLDAVKSGETDASAVLESERRRPGDMIPPGPRKSLIDKLEGMAR